MGYGIHSDLFGGWGWVVRVAYDSHPILRSMSPGVYDAVSG